METGCLIYTANEMNSFYMKCNTGRCSGVFTVNFKQISYIVLVFPLMTLASKCRLRLCLLNRLGLLSGITNRK